MKIEEFRQLYAGYIVIIAVIALSFAHVVQWLERKITQKQQNCIAIIGSGNQDIHIVVNGVAYTDQDADENGCIHPEAPL